MTMARSMIQRRQEAVRERLATFDASLRRVSAARRPPPDFEKALKDAKKGFESLILRDAWAWQPHMKTRDDARLRLAAARHLFARYPVAAPLERIWLDCDGLDGDEVKLRKRWYIAAARGDSLYKAGASGWLSRKEVHAFLNAPGDLCFEEAFWLAIASGYAGDTGMALRIARSKIAGTPRQDLAFWREVARFFCANAAVSEEIDDLCDYLAARHAADRGYSIKGRTLVSLRRQLRAWHRELELRARIEATRQRALRAAGVKTADTGRWAGSPLQDWMWQPPGKEARFRRESFAVVQLVTADDLVAEGSAMHHCVWSYAAKCIAGQVSIWSLRRTVAGSRERLLTVEVDSRGRAVQVRGFANRLARPEEMTVLVRWAKARGILLA
jgi:hypothetical protein